MSERIRGSYDDALYKSTYTLLNFTLLRLPSSVAVLGTASSPRSAERRPAQLE